MRTKNFKAVAAMMFERCGVNKGLLPVVGVDGNTYYLTPNNYSNGYPYNTTLTLQGNSTYAGFCVGSGSTAATEDDYDLVNQITSGLSASIVQNAYLDEDDNPAVDYDLMITNTSAEPIIIGEIGFKQPLYTSTVQGTGTSLYNRVCLLDRTVLASPVTIEAGAYAVIRYTMKSSVS